MDALLGKINKLSNWQAAFTIVAVGFIVFFAGLMNSFVGDDVQQIVNNPVVHSLSNFKLFYEGSTFYNGGGIAPLAGLYYRPLMTTAFSLIYTIFGSHTLPYHLLQLMLCIGSAIFLFLIFRYTFSPLLSLILALLFLVLPINSQVVYAIASMQDALFFFFGILAIWILLRFESVRSLFLVAACLFLSLLSKEAGLLFVILALLYLFWFDRKRLLKFLGILVLPITVYFWLKLSAVGFNSQGHSAPIDNLSLSGRLLTTPSVLLLYFSKLIFPWKLSASYYWTHSSFSVQHVLVPLIIDVAILAGAIYAGFVVRKKTNKALFLTYLFFSSWTLIGLVPYLQIVPMDMTVCETWFYFSTAGLLGMIGVLLMTYKPRIQFKRFVAVCAIIISCLAIRTALRATDWSNAYTLATRNIAAAQDNYVSYNVVSEHMIKQGNFLAAKPYVEQSIKLYPSFSNYNNLGLILANQNDYFGSLDAFNSGLKYGSSVSIYENMGELALADAPEGYDVQQLSTSVNLFPNDYVLLEFLSIAQARNGDLASAKSSIMQAAKLGDVPQIMIDRINNSQPFNYNLGSIGKTIVVNQK